MKSLPPSQPSSVATASDSDASSSTGPCRVTAQSVAADPIRILAGGGGAFARLLVESAGGDGIPEAPLRRLAEALSVPLPAPPAAPLSTAASAAHAARWGVLRSSAASIVGLAVIGALASQWPTRAPQVNAAAPPPELASGLPSASAAGALSAATLASLAPAAPAAATPTAASAGDGALAPINATRRPPEARRGARAAAPPKARGNDEASALTQELRALELAQRALRAGRVDAAERALGAYRQRFRRPTLAVEAELLEIDLLMARGQRPAAEVRARALIARAGAGRYRERLAALLPDEASVR
jgi:hypothetical protein